MYIDRNGNPAQLFGWGAHQQISYSGGDSYPILDPVDDVARVVLIWATTACYFAIGGEPTATSADPAIPANSPIYVPMPPGHKVAFLRVSADGVGHVTECR